MEKIKNFLEKNKKNSVAQSDTAYVKIGELMIAMTRKIDLPIAHEFSIFIPRVEIRDRYYQDNQLLHEQETIYSSITIVHAPRPEPDK